MIRKVLMSDNPLLRKVSKPIRKVDKKDLALVKDLKDTLVIQKDPEGVGLAAPQIGKQQRVFVMRRKKEILSVINPEIISVEKTGEEKKKSEKTLEGCLSVPHYYSPLVRPQKLQLKYTNEQGVEVEEEFLGFDAQIVQHEIDHLEGILFVDRILKKKIPLYKLNKSDEWEEVDFV